jgi:hypothetical protein
MAGVNTGIDEVLVDVCAECLDRLGVAALGGAGMSASIPEDWVEEAAVAPACPCGEPALFVALVHRVSECSQMGLDLTPDGAEIHVLCADCLQGMADDINVFLRSQYRHISQGRVVSCYTCGRPLTELHDVLEVQPV